MKLLFDHNLSPRLVDRLADVYPQAEHVYLIGLDRASDEVMGTTRVKMGIQSSPVMLTLAN